MPLTRTLCLLFSILFFAECFPQAVTPFTGCPDVYVVAFKNGTSCTKAAYNFYKADINGTLLGAPFASTPDTVEINGIGLNPIDGFFYGLRYNRSAACVFSMTKVIRMDANGGNTSLGSIRPPLGGSVGSAVGVVSINDKYIFSASDASTSYIGVINNISSLTPPANDTLEATYLPLVNNCPGKIYSDWALKFGSGLLYTYGIYMQAGVVTGTVIKIDPITGVLDCIGTPNITEFNDISRDNFGGLMFGSDGFLYGFNVNTRKYYKIDVTTGTVLLVNTIAGSGQLRGDLGSCATGLTILPLTLSSFNVSERNCSPLLQWKAGSGENLRGFEIERSDNGTTFRTINYTGNSGSNNGGNYSFLDNARGEKVYYRLKTISGNGDINYSDIVVWRKNCDNSSLQKRIELTTNGNSLVVKYISLKNEKMMTQVISNDGRILISKNINVYTGENNFIIYLNHVAAGIYTLRSNTGNAIFTDRFIKN